MTDPIDLDAELLDAVFQEHDLALLEVLDDAQTEAATEQSRIDALAKATGVRDQRTLQMLLDRGITADKAAALALIPLVAVAWADGRLQDDEIHALMTAAHNEGIEKGTPAYELFHRWLLAEPNRRLRVAWANYVISLCKNLSDTAREALREQTLDRAIRVAQAAGGFLGIGDKISDTEQEILDELSMAFDR